MKPATLLRLYPRKWRERYGEEFLALLHQTGVGWRQVIDVAAAASREWVMALVRWPALRFVAQQFRSGLGFFAIAWVATALGQVTYGRFGRSVDLASGTVQAQMVGLFLVSALVCRTLERLAFRFVLKGRATTGERIFLNVSAYLVVAVAVFCLEKWLPHSTWLAGLGNLNFFMMNGEFFGRPAFGNPTTVNSVGASA